MRKLVLFACLIFIISSCAQSLSPADRYAKEHASKEFTSWETIGKKMDNNDKSKPKEHDKKNKY